MTDAGDDRVRSIVAVGLVVLGVLLIVGALLGWIVGDDVDLSGAAKVLAVIVGALLLLAGVTLRSPYRKQDPA